MAKAAAPTVPPTAQRWRLRCGVSKRIAAPNGKAYASWPRNSFQSIRGPPVWMSSTTQAMQRKTPCATYAQKNPFSP